MADVKLVVIYPHSKDVDVFEKVYQQEHVPLAVAKLRARPRSWQQGYSARRKVFLPSTASPQYIFRRCKLWKHARLLKVARRRSRGEDFFRRTANFPGSRGRDRHVHTNGSRLALTDQRRTCIPRSLSGGSEKRRASQTFSHFWLEMKLRGLLAS